MCRCGNLYNYRANRIQLSAVFTKKSQDGVEASDSCNMKRRLSIVVPERERATGFHQLLHYHLVTMPTGT